MLVLLVLLGSRSLGSPELLKAFKPRPMQSKEHHNRAMDPFSAAAKMVKMAGHLIQTIITADEANRTTVVLRSLGAELFGHSLAFDATLTNLGRARWD